MTHAGHKHKAQTQTKPTQGSSVIIVMMAAGAVPQRIRTVMNVDAMASERGAGIAFEPRIFAVLHVHFHIHFSQLQQLAQPPVDAIRDGFCGTHRVPKEPITLALVATAHGGGQNE